MTLTRKIWTARSLALDKGVVLRSRSWGDAEVAHGVMFHHFHGKGHPVEQGSISSEELANLLEFVGRERILPAQQWLERAASHRLRPGDVCLTFDDNLMCQYDVALPVLRQFGLTAFWFTYTSVVQGNIEPLEVYRRFRSSQFALMESFYEAFFQTIEDSVEVGAVRQALQSFDPTRFLAACTFYSDRDRQFRFVRDEVLGPQRYATIMDRMIAAAGFTHQQLAQGLWIGVDQLRILQGEDHVIGLHSHTHPTRVNQLSPDGQRDEYERNHACLTQLVGVTPTAMSHPCNSYNVATLEILKQLGIRVGFRANMERLSDYVDRALEHPREDHANLMKQMAGAAV